jgi:putative phosphoribosyl transferase
MRAALAALRVQQVERVIIAVPVAPISAMRELLGAGEEVVCVRAEEQFEAIGNWYEDFTQTSDREVCSLLEAARQALLA